VRGKRVPVEMKGGVGKYREIESFLNKKNIIFRRNEEN
jgi:hypothetical protein